MRLFNCEENLVLERVFNRSDVEDLEDEEGVKINWNPDNLNNTSLVTQGDDWYGGVGATGGEFKIKEGLDLSLHIPSGILHGRIRHIVVDNMADWQTVRIKVFLEDIRWEGRWGGFNAGRSGLFGWDAERIHRADVVTSIAEETISLQEYRAARYLRDKFIGYGVGRAHKRELLTMALSKVQDFKDSI